MAPVSPRQKSTYSWPSTSAKRAPSAQSTKTGKGPAHLTIQFMGTPSSSDALARSCRARERGWASVKRRSSAAIRSARRRRSMIGTVRAPSRTSGPRLSWRTERLLAAQPQHGTGQEDVEVDDRGRLLCLPTRAVAADDAVMGRRTDYRFGCRLASPPRPSPLGSPGCRDHAATSSSSLPSAMSQMQRPFWLGPLKGRTSSVATSRGPSWSWRARRPRAPSFGRLARSRWPPRSRPEAPQLAVGSALAYPRRRGHGHPALG